MARRAGGAALSDRSPLVGALRREERTVAAMLVIYCRDHRHRPGRRVRRADELCPDCAALLAYAAERLRGCRYGAAKPTCANCPVHCYRPVMRERVREVMRYSGPRMIRHHPVLAVSHLAKGRRRSGPAGGSGRSNG